jgi:hypothetical protein
LIMRFKDEETGWWVGGGGGGGKKRLYRIGVSKGRLIGLILDVAWSSNRTQVRRDQGFGHCFQVRRDKYVNRTA